MQVECILMVQVWCCNAVVVLVVMVVVLVENSKLN